MQGLVDTAVMRNRDMKIRKLLIIVIYSLLVVFLILIKNEYSEYLLRNSTYGMRTLIDRGEVENLYVGSSTFRQGLDIAVMEERFNDSYIISYNGNQPVYEYIQIKKLVDNGVNIKNLYIDMYVYSAIRDPGLEDEKMLLELNLEEKKEVYRLLSDRGIEQWWRVFVSSCNEMILTWPASGRIVDRCFRKGGTLLYTNGMSEQEFSSLSESTICGEINKEQKAAINSIIDLCNDNGIKLAFVETPKAYNILKSKGYQDIMNQYEALLADRNVQVIRYTGDGMKSNDFSDDIHMSTQGRKAFTGWLTDKIYEDSRDQYGM